MATTRSNPETIDAAFYALTGVAVLTQLIVIVIVLVKRKDIEVEPTRDVVPIS